ncbi:hypothetical protein P171DRAFT_436673 [Karstenula rhodostoma CBS 690.94]|uniref:Uncharacterized protein n=1 Tax=Karstenula rhodostoma CBS 690.94 TaxID=1392251 RepID=A0A9P4U649_9PLEO|nr:hypothetical protein P171DRAFT_436673 [Karstenula rhodostoma CBS 690.94]
MRRGRNEENWRSKDRTGIGGGFLRPDLQAPGMWTSLRPAETGPTKQPGDERTPENSLARSRRLTTKTLARFNTRRSCVVRWAPCIKTVLEAGTPLMKVASHCRILTAVHPPSSLVTAHRGTPCLSSRASIGIAAPIAPSPVSGASLFSLSSHNRHPR